MLTGQETRKTGSQCQAPGSHFQEVLCLGGAKKQGTVALSTAAAKYVSLSMQCPSRVLWIRRLNSEIDNPPCELNIILKDYQSAIAMGRNPQLYRRAKHIDK